MPPHLLFVPATFLTIWDISSCVYILGLFFFYFYKGTSLNLIGRAFNLYATLGNMINLAILNLSISKHGLSFHILLSCLVSFFPPVSCFLVPISRTSLFTSIPQFFIHFLANYNWIVFFNFPFRQLIISV